MQLFWWWNSKLESVVPFAMFEQLVPRVSLKKGKWENAHQARLAIADYCKQNQATLFFIIIMKWRVLSHWSSWELECNWWCFNLLWALTSRQPCPDDCDDDAKEKHNLLMKIFMNLLLHKGTSGLKKRKNFGKVPKGEGGAAFSSQNIYVVYFGTLNRTFWA